jgi:hypothetical protein
MPLSLLEFAARWKASILNERSAAQSHFLGPISLICAMCSGNLIRLHADQTGESLTLKKHVSRLKGGNGYGGSHEGGAKRAGDREPHMTQEPDGAGACLAGAVRFQRGARPGESPHEALAANNKWMKEYL